MTEVPGWVWMLTVALGLLNIWAEMISPSTTPLGSFIMAAVGLTAALVGAACLVDKYSEE